MIGKHTGLVRRQLHLVYEQLHRDGITVDDQSIGDETQLAHNALISVVGAGIPYKDLFGRTPNMLTDLEPASAVQLDDQHSGPSGVSRHINRLREAALTSIDCLDIRIKKDTPFHQPFGEYKELLGLDNHTINLSYN